MKLLSLVFFINSLLWSNENKSPIVHLALRANKELNNIACKISLVLPNSNPEVLLRPIENYLIWNNKIIINDIETKDKAALQSNRIKYTMHFLKLLYETFHARAHLLHDYVPDRVFTKEELAYLIEAKLFLFQLDPTLDLNKLEQDLIMQEQPVPPSRMRASSMHLAHQESAFRRVRSNTVL